MKNVMKAAHKMTKEIKSEYPNVNYKFQLGLCISYLSKGENKMLKRTKLTVDATINDGVIMNYCEERWLVTLAEGSEKQITWAESIIRDRIKETSSILEAYATKGAKEESLSLVLNKLIQKLNNNNDSKFWIDTRNTSIDKFLLA